jgi:hypothetical protein
MGRIHGGDVCGEKYEMKPRAKADGTCLCLTNYGARYGYREFCIATWSICIDSSYLINNHSEHNSGRIKSSAWESHCHVLA